MSSVVLKVRPTFVDYFHFTQLEPWIHYIPVDADDDGNSLEDNLLSTVQWVLHHPNETQTIVNNANSWCSRHMIRDSLSYDLLDIWEYYAKKLYQGTLYSKRTDRNHTWMKELRESLFHPSNEMAEVKTLLQRKMGQ